LTKTTPSSTRGSLRALPVRRRLLRRRRDARERGGEQERRRDHSAFGSSALRESASSRATSAATSSSPSSIGAERIGSRWVVGVGAAAVEADHLLERRDAAVVHVGRGEGDHPQRRRLEAAAVGLVVRDREASRLRHAVRRADAGVVERSSLKFGPAWQRQQRPLLSKIQRPRRSSGV
jgi:hypothetical protein